MIVNVYDCLITCSYIHTFHFTSLHLLSDAYMVAGNIEPEVEDHAQRCTLFACEMIDVAKHCYIDTETPSMGMVCDVM